MAIFFDALTDDYTAAIERCFPRYREMLWAVLDYLPDDRKFGSILELGCGTGNLSVLLSKAYPDATIRFVDVSGESLDACSARLEQNGRHFFDQQDFVALDYENGSFDLVVSSIAIHHLDADGKRSLFHRIQSWLIDDGILCFADQCAGAANDVTLRHMENWRTIAKEAGATESEWEMWMTHQQEHDHHDTLVDQLDWLRQASFTVVDSPWRYLLWSVIQARKQG